VLYKGKINIGKGAHVARIQWELYKYQIKPGQIFYVSGRLSEKRSRNILHDAIPLSHTSGLFPRRSAQYYTRERLKKKGSTL
jgi:hypothetical protein